MTESLLEREAQLPMISVKADQFLNYFYHTTSLFPEFFDPFALQRSNVDPAHLEKYRYMRTKGATQALRRLSRVGRISSDPFYVEQIMTDETLTDLRFETVLAWKEFFRETVEPFREVWKGELRQKLYDYSNEFCKVWEPISDSILSMLSHFARQEWKVPEIDVNLVRCLNGGSNVSKGIVIVPYPDFDVEIKLLTHELAHMVVPEGRFRELLGSLGISSAGRFDTAHALVDYVAYLSSRQYFKNPSRKGLRPNIDFYHEGLQLSLAFEEYARSSETYESLEDFVKYATKRFGKDS